MPLSTLYVKLMKGKQLSGATILTTCRPDVVQSIPDLTDCRIVEIMGFTPEKVHEYINKCTFCEGTDADESDQLANTIWELVRTNVNLLSLCYIPVICRIICYLMKDLVTKHSQTLPRKLTQVYEGALRVFIFKHHPDYKGKEFRGTEEFSDSLEEALSRLGSLAKSGIEVTQLIFGPSMVQPEMENCGLLNRMPDRKISTFKCEPNFCFIHLTFQEFLAAREIAKMNPSDIKDFFTSCASDPKWHMVIQFVAGLLATGDTQENEAAYSLISLLQESLADLEVSKENTQKALLMMKCLNEYGNDAVMEKALSALQKNSKFSNILKFSSCQVTPVDCTAIVPFVKCLECTALELAFNHVTNHGISLLCDALKDVNCKLTKLNLKCNDITEQGVSHLCDTLKDANCKLTELDLGCNYITTQGAAQNEGHHGALDFFFSHTFNSVLNLADQKISYQGLSHLCESLKDVNCKLTKLDLSFAKIADQGVSHLCNALKDVNCKLTKLNLSGNKITDQGVSNLCDALKDVNCKLTKLELSGNKITDQGVSNLCDALKDVNCKLTKLNLSGNKITDQGVSNLCDALKDVNCKLTKLELRCNNIMDQGLSHLCNALKDVNCKLTKLDLSGNKITDQGVSNLCDALKDVNCKLTQLSLCRSDITDQGVSHLCNALKDTNCKLTKLDLQLNKITDQGVPHMCDALKDINCKLTKLNLFGNDITYEGASHLCNALKDENCQVITQLDLQL